MVGHEWLHAPTGFAARSWSPVPSSRYWPRPVPGSSELTRSGVGCGGTESGSRPPAAIRVRRFAYPVPRHQWITVIEQVKGLAAPTTQGPHRRPDPTDSISTRESSSTDEPTHHKITDRAKIGAVTAVST